MTDVTGFGLLGHALEMCRGAGLGLRLSRGAVPFLPGVLDHARNGLATGASARNWVSYGGAVSGADALDQVLLTDPQTSGGLLLAVDAGTQADFLAAARDHGHHDATVIGHFIAGGGIDLTA